MRQPPPPVWRMRDFQIVPRGLLSGRGRRRVRRGEAALCRGRASLPRTVGGAPLRGPAVDLLGAVRVAARRAEAATAHAEEVDAELLLPLLKRALRVHRHRGVGAEPIRDRIDPGFQAGRPQIALGSIPH